MKDKIIKELDDVIHHIKNGGYNSAIILLEAIKNDCIKDFKEGYLLLYSETDEVHADLISEEHYLKIKEAPTDKEQDVAFDTNPLHRWFTQTHCVEPWPYTNIKILGTICILRC